MLSVLAIAATIAGAIASISLLTLLLAGSPNSTPEFYAKLKFWMIFTAVAGTAIVVAAIWTLAEGHPLISLLIGGFPILVLIGLIAWVLTFR